MTDLVDAEQRYELLEVVGSGGMATVWRARDVRLDRIVAFKRPHPSPSDSSVAARFGREARLAATVSHPNLVTVFDAGSDGRGPYLVMEFIEGPSLDGAQISPDTIATLGAQVASGLAALHAAGIAHGDVKPANILIADDQAKLTDFGIARPLDQTSALTQAGMALATPAYAAPETLAHGHRTPAADVYSLAAVLFELAAGSRWTTSPTDTRPMLGDDRWRATLERALSPDPAMRPSASAFATQLAGLDAGRTGPLLTEVPPTEVMPVTSGAGDGDRRRRPNRWLLLAVAVIVGVGLITVAALADDDVPPGATSDPSSIESGVVASTVAATVQSDPPTTPPATVPITSPASISAAPPPVDQTRQQFVALVAGITGGELKDKEADDLVKHVDEAIASAARGDLEHAQRELVEAAKRIDRHVESEPTRGTAADLLLQLAEQLRVATAPIAGELDNVT